jgi:hypothetical protein
MKSLLTSPDFVSELQGQDTSESRKKKGQRGNYNKPFALFIWTLMSPVRLKSLSADASPSGSQMTNLKSQVAV